MIVTSPWPNQLLADAIQVATSAPSALNGADAGGIALNIATLAVVTALVGSLAGAIALLFRMVTSTQTRQIERLTEERDALLEKLFETVATADRAASAGEKAGALLTPRQKRERKL